MNAAKKKSKDVVVYFTGNWAYEHVDGRVDALGVGGSNGSMRSIIQNWGEYEDDMLLWIEDNSRLTDPPQYEVKKILYRHPLLVIFHFSISYPSLQSETGCETAFSISLFSFTAFNILFLSNNSALLREDHLHESCRAGVTE